MQEEHERPRIYRDVLCRIDCKVRTINDDLTGIKFYSYVLLSWIYTVISHAAHLSYQLEFFEYLGRNLQNFHWLLQVAKTKERWADHTEFLYFLFCSFFFLWIPICFFSPGSQLPNCLILLCNYFLLIFFTAARCQLCNCLILLLWIVLKSKRPLPYYELSRSLKSLNIIITIIISIMMILFFQDSWLLYSPKREQKQGSWLKMRPRRSISSTNYK